MPDIQKVSVALTGEQVAALKVAVASGEYATTSEIVREALRDWQRKREVHTEDLESLRQSWNMGKQSGHGVAVNLAEMHRRARGRLKEASSRHAGHAG